MRLTIHTVRARGLAEAVASLARLALIPFSYEFLWHVTLNVLIQELRVVMEIGGYHVRIQI